ncbi:hypothetical protein BCR34DRAFT_627561 [Clohesyomyces aquaticus]|uniref:Actin-like ATPase domain-containing protein n=1 Tax=Clohesyomyces aquaticus TaxID=1231657 RepID=A0A1Y1YWE1_9PLEO|nr:hypothetical protein BCR34DRAFT_627561 [Clohesyomyces aquaticus]
MPDCLYIGIDFGTTFSGVAWAFSRQPDNIKIVTKWRAKGAFNADDAKTPTEIVYALSGRNRMVRNWGYEIEANQTPLKWFKLCLEDENQLPQDVQKSDQLAAARKMLVEKSISAVDAAADYLRELWKATIASLERELGSPAVDGLPFRVVVTVPAMWSDGAKNRTLRAAEQAGIKENRLCGRTTLDLIPEPEAAALATLAKFRGRPDISPNDIITVCDCGGGTVDITSYKIQNPDPVVVKESVGGDGKMCGGIFVDEEFRDFVRGRVKNRWDKLSPEMIRKIMNEEWENGIKRTFEDDGREFRVTLPAEATQSLFHRSKTSTLPLTGKTVQTLFDPVLGQIRSLVLKQIGDIKKKEGKPPKCIMLVGGFGRCSYLYTALTKILGTQGIAVLQAAGEEPWTAICRGAVIRAMSTQGYAGAGGVTITTRVSKRNYGLAFYEPFRTYQHLPEDREWIASEGDYFANNQIRWYLRKGVDIATQNPVVMSFYRLCQSSQEIQNNQVTAKIFISEVEGAPNRKTRDVTELCEIKVKLDTPYHLLPRHTNNVGKECRRISYDIEVICSGGLLKFAAIMNGVRQPAQNVEASFM